MTLSAETLLPKITQKPNYPTQQSQSRAHLQSSVIPSSPILSCEKKIKLTTMAPERVTQHCSFTIIMSNVKSFLDGHFLRLCYF